jgi:hypothetical protein
VLHGFQPCPGGRPMPTAKLQTQIFRMPKVSPLRFSLKDSRNQGQCAKIVGQSVCRIGGILPEATAHANKLTVTFCCQIQA